MSSFHSLTMSCTKASTTASLPYFHLPHQALLLLGILASNWFSISGTSFDHFSLLLLGFNSYVLSENTTVLFYPISVGIPQGSATFCLHLETLTSFLYLLAILPTSVVEFPLGVATILLHQCKDYNFPIFNSN